MNLIYEMDNGVAALNFKLHNGRTLDSFLARFED